MAMVFGAFAAAFFATFFLAGAFLAGAFFAAFFTDFFVVFFAGVFWAALGGADSCSEGRVDATARGGSIVVVGCGAVGAVAMKRRQPSHPSRPKAATASSHRMRRICETLTGLPQGCPLFTRSLGQRRAKPVNGRGALPKVLLLIRRQRDRVLTHSSPGHTHGAG